MRIVIAGEIKVRYVAEWISVLNDLPSVSPDWVEVFAIPDYALPSELADAKRALDRDARYRDVGRGEMDTDIREWANGAFNRDVIVATQAFNAVFGVTTLFEPLLGRAGTERTHVGDLALEVLVPNISAAPWEAIAEFRELPAARDARDRLRDMEKRALSEEPRTINAARVKVAQEVNNDLMHALERWRPSVPEEIGRQAITGAASALVPLVGPIVGVAEAAKNAREFNRSWYAALMHLRRSVSSRRSA
jgi:hypothetical protein